MPRVSIDRDFTRDLLVRLIQINSVNPALVPGAPGEREICDHIAGLMRGLGLAVEMREPEPGRTSVVARLVGRGGARSLMLNGHIDTVGVEGMAEPFSGAIRAGRVYGRGAFDMKGGVAAMIGALAALVRAGAPLRGDVVLAAVGDEEYASLGTEDLLNRVRTDAAIVGEPTALDICRAHKGFVWIEVETAGRAAHGSRFDLGLDANLKLGQFLAALAGLERELRARPPHPLVGPPSLHAALLSGGSGMSTYAASARVQIERRTVPGESAAQTVAEVQALVDRLAADDPDFHASVRPFFAREPFEAPAGAGIVRALERAAAGILGRTPRQIGDTPWMDAALCQAAGIKTVVFGATGAGAHAAEEWVDLESVYAMAEIITATALDYCSGE
jgi:acetylornithine deacetylase